MVAVGLTIAFAAVPEYLAGAIATGPGSKLPSGLLVGALAGAVVYNALFVMLTAVFSPTRALAFGLLYILLWEGLLASLIPGVGLLSVEHYSLAIANSIAHNSALDAHLSRHRMGMGVVGHPALLAEAALSFRRVCAQRDRLSAWPEATAACWRPAGTPARGRE